MAGGRQSEWSRFFCVFPDSRGVPGHLFVTGRRSDVICEYSCIGEALIAQCDGEQMVILHSMNGLSFMWSKTKSALYILQRVYHVVLLLLHGPCLTCFKSAK